MFIAQEIFEKNKYYFLILNREDYKLIVKCKNVFKIYY